MDYEKWLEDFLLVKPKRELDSKTISFDEIPKKIIVTSTHTGWMRILESMFAHLPRFHIILSPASLHIVRLGLHFAPEKIVWVEVRPWKSFDEQAQQGWVNMSERTVFLNGRISFYLFVSPEDVSPCGFFCEKYKKEWEWKIMSHVDEGALFALIKPCFDLTVLKAQIVACL
jgi:hypothetical protein